MNECQIRGKVSDIEYKFIIKHRSNNKRKIIPIHNIDNEKSICTFTIETGGEDFSFFGREEGTKLNVVAFDKQADFCYRYLSQDKVCMVVGYVENYQIDFVEETGFSYVRVNKIYLL